MSYTLGVRVDGEFEAVLERTTDALADEGFGVLTEIDVRETMREKLDEEFRRYRILGACIPSLAHQALTADLFLGTLLPCNVVVYETDDGGVGVRTIDPEALLSLVDDPDVARIAGDVRARFDRVLDELSAAPA